MRSYRVRRRARIRRMLLIAVVGSCAAAWKFGWWPTEDLRALVVRVAGRESGLSKPIGPDSSDNVRYAEAVDGEHTIDEVVFIAQVEPPIDGDPNSAASPPALLTPGRRIAALRDDPTPPTISPNIAILADSQQRPATQSSSEAPRALSPEPNSFPAPIPDGSWNREPSQTERPIDLAEIDRQIAAGKDLDAHRELSRLFWERPEIRPQIQERIETTSKRIFFSPQPHYTEAHVVQPGEQLRVIARKYQVPWQYLAKLNRIDPRRIRANQKLKVLRGPFCAFVDLSDFELVVHAHGYYVRKYPVAIGKDGTTPVGRFTVQNKLEDPTYYGPDGEVIANDDPKNPLGERWIDIGDSYGIHGTIEEDLIGTAVSRGCVRLRSTDVEEVYDMLDIGSEVVIRR